MDFETPLRNNVPIGFHIFCALFPILPWLIFATIIEDFEVDLFLVVFVPFAFLFYVLEFYFLKILGFFGVRAYFSYPIFLFLITSFFYFLCSINTGVESEQKESEIKSFFSMMFICFFFPSLMPFLAKVMADVYHFIMFKFEQKIEGKTIK